MTGPPTRGKKNSTTPGKSSDQDLEAIEDSKPNEEFSKFKEEVKKDMCDLRGDISDIRSMLSTFMNETRKEVSRNQGETFKSTNDDTNFNPPGSKNFFPKVDMHKFDGKDPLTWINQMENFFEIHEIFLFFYFKYFSFIYYFVLLLKIDPLIIQLLFQIFGQKNELETIIIQYIIYYCRYIIY